jgi:hypothetical protein
LKLQSKRFCIFLFSYSVPEPQQTHIKIYWLEKFEAEYAMEKNQKTIFSKGGNQTEAIVKGVSSVSDTVCTKKIKPRALIFKANYKDFDEIKELIKTQFPEVEIIYATTGPTASILRVTKSIPFETQDTSTQPLFTVE